MDYEKLSELHEEFAKQTMEMTNEFIVLFEKWKKKSLRLSAIMAIHMPINLIMNLIQQDENSALPRLFEDLPEVFERFLNPFVKIKKKWGKISSPEFAKLYNIEYQKQFDDLFVDIEYKKQFEKWFENKQNSSIKNDKNKNNI